MKSIREIRSFLCKEFGYNINNNSIAEWQLLVKKRMHLLNFQDSEAYLLFLRNDPNEIKEWVELLIVPETWFFREEQAFDFMLKYIKLRMKAEGDDKIFRILSIPCASGEEPYSVAITLLENNIDRSRFQIDAIDVSEQALEKAKKAVYSSYSFRNPRVLKDYSKYFDIVGNAYTLKQEVRSLVSFKRYDVRDPSLIKDYVHYDVIFCRYLLIYLDPETAQYLVETLYRLLSKEGLIISTPVEVNKFFDHETFIKVSKFEAQFFSKHAIFLKTQKSSMLDFLNKHYSCVKEDERKVQKKEMNTIRSSIKTLGDESNVTGLDHKSHAYKPLQTIESKQVKSEEEKKKSFEELQRLANFGHLEEALRNCLFHLETYINDEQAYNLLGTVYYALKKVDKAKEAFDKAIYLNPFNYESLVFLSLIYEEIGDYRQVECLQKRIKTVLSKI